MGMVDITTDAIVAITSTDMALRWNPSAFGVFLVGALLLGLSLPRFLSALALTHVPETIDAALGAGAPISEADRLVAVQAYRSALRFQPGSSLVHQNLGRVLMRDVQVSPSSTTPDAALVAASQSFDDSIRHAPSRAFPWALQALALSKSNGDPRRLEMFLNYSYLLGPHEASSLLIRASVVAKTFQSMPDGIQENFRHDVARIWNSAFLRRDLLDIYLAAPLKVRSEIRRAALITNRDRAIFDAGIRRMTGLPNPNH